MSHDNFQPNPQKYTITAILSFLCIFAILTLFMHCEGDYKPSGTHHATKHEAVKEDKSHSEAITKNMLQIL